LAKEWFQRLAKDNEKVSVSFKLICSVSNVSRTEKDIVKLCERISSGTVLVSPQAYQQYVDYTVAHLYVTNPQARIGAIQSLTLSGYAALRANGIVPCSDFKTADTYAYQCVSACAASQRYQLSWLHSFNSHRFMEVYVDLFRSKIVAEDQHKEFFFLTLNGKRMMNLGRFFISSFHLELFDVDASPASLRSMVISILLPPSSGMEDSIFHSH
jgi:hypothetical protein